MWIVNKNNRKEKEQSLGSGSTPSGGRKRVERKGGDSSPISLGCRSMLLRQPKLEEKMLSICRSSMLSAVSAC